MDEPSVAPCANDDAAPGGVRDEIGGDRSDGVRSEPEGLLTGKASQGISLVVDSSINQGTKVIGPRALVDNSEPKVACSRGGAAQSVSAVAVGVSVE